ncbi:MAG: TIGR00304 family protein [Nitrososphaerota archaeon]|nr:TIGR00304 family protein [Nitrososphaerota archaeon]MDG7039942.1 TIGR00304 family protein [Nitrososphaerota archaeon]MDG7042248.1 TIGR00304 family protein [Nitrososphaerota archaeon]MDG7045235.1 TIGR00304 family protein [Nitrososphaerota archaeon]MDG7046608.1 TIGR00304 family protein [Nitrososphaerota archaeon]
MRLRPLLLLFGFMLIIAGVVLVFIGSISGGASVGGAFFVFPIPIIIVFGKDNGLVYPIIVLALLIFLIMLVISIFGFRRSD